MKLKDATKVTTEYTDDCEHVLTAGDTAVVYDVSVVEHVTLETVRVPDTDTSEVDFDDVDFDFALSLKTDPVFDNAARRRSHQLRVAFGYDDGAELLDMGNGNFRTLPTHCE